jgi:hypothetical protein
LNWFLVGFLGLIAYMLWGDLWDEVRDVEFYDRYFIDLPEFQSWTKDKTAASYNSNNEHPARGFGRNLQQAAVPLDTTKLREATFKNIKRNYGIDDSQGD